MWKQLIVVGLLITSLANAQTPAPEHDAGDNGPATAAFLNFPESIAVDRRGNIYFSERGGNRIRRIDARSGIVTTIAGTGEASFGGDGGPAVKATLTQPTGIAIASNGDVIVGDTFNHRIRRIDARTGVIRTVAGTGESKSTGDGGPASAAAITAPFGILLDRNDNIFFTDTEVHRIRRIDAQTGIVTTVAGNGVWAFAGDGGPATAASLARPHVMTWDRDGNLIIGDSFNQRIRRIDQRTGIITTIAGNGLRGSSGDGGPALNASFCYFGDLALDRNGDLLVSGVCDQRIRRVSLRTGVVTPFAGKGKAEFSGDGGPAITAGFHLPAGLAFEADGDLLVTDMKNHRIRRIDARTGNVMTIAGGPQPRNPVITWRFVYDREEVARDLSIPIAYDVEGMDSTQVREDIRYADDAMRRFDLYLPQGTAASDRKPLVVIVPGRNDVEILPDDWGAFRARGRAFAAAGFATIVFNHRLGLNGSIVQAADDVRHLLDYVRSNAAALNVDESRVAVVAYSMGAAALTEVQNVRCIAAFYPWGDLRELPDWQVPGKTADNAARYSLAATLPSVPLFVVRTGKDPAHISSAIDRMIAAALQKNVAVEVINHPTGEHGFDRNPSDPYAISTMRRAIEFVRTCTQ